MKLKFFLVFISIVFSFSLFADTCERHPTKLNKSKIAGLEKAIGGLVYYNLQVLESEYNNVFPTRNWLGFGQFKKNEWLPEYNISREKIQCAWDKYGWPLEPEFAKMGKLYKSIIDVDLLSIKMMSSLRRYKTGDSLAIEKEIQRLKDISKKYKIN